MLTLSPKELAEVLGLTGKLQNECVSCMVPPVVLHTLLQAAQGLLHTTQITNTALVPRGVPVFGEDPAQTYITSLNRYLSHRWRQEVLNTSTSVKKDDAAVPIHLWNRRITDLFPSLTDKILDAL